MNNIKQISPLNDKFLQRTSVIDKPPKRLWYQGNLPEPGPTVAIVGSRKPTEYGRGVTLRLSAALAARGVIIVSGLAIGHDSLAAQGALEGGGITIGIVGNGLANKYPRTTWALREEIIKQNGAVISEYEPETPVYRGNFLWRNRLITALSDVVIVVEAGASSGTLNTAAHALTQNKELMAVPGNITSPLSIGCNRLIAQGAVPVLSVDDVMEKLRDIYASRGAKVTAKFLASLPTSNNIKQSSAELVRTIRGQNNVETAILRALASGITDGDEILRTTQLAATDYNIAMTMLEVNGRIRALGANTWALK
ncbi:MAG: DNA-processing protein DprA [Candidatus Nomurabacteria bacterium]|jgi:DNA processing protein|nr:DNA-processing protein DprA [Candidatus Nomurabacteria bacterium]